MEENHKPDFDSIKHLTPYEQEYWSARELAPLLGYSRWENFETAIRRSITACKQVNQIEDDHFKGVTRTVQAGKGAQREIKDYLLSRFACYLIAQNGDPRKSEIAHAQAYFAVAARTYEITQLREEQEKRLKLRERVSESNKKLSEAAYNAGVLTRNFGVFQNAGYRGLYNEMGVDEIKAYKGIDAKEDILDRMGRAELAANEFRITQTEEKLRKDGIIGQSRAMDTHYDIGRKVRKTIEEIGGTMPENLPPETSIKPLLDERRKNRKKLASPKTTPAQVSLWGESEPENKDENSQE